jgi:hypothetical protein
VSGVRDAIHHGSLYPVGITFVRQFALGPSAVEWPGWRHRAVAGGSVLSHHHELHVASFSRHDVEIHLLGILVSPMGTGAPDEDVLRAALSGIDCRDPVAVEAGLSRTAGRWVVIHSHEGRVSVMTDPCGLRQVCFGLDSERHAWCCSQPWVVPTLAVGGSDAEVLEHLEIVKVRGDPEAWCPGTRTPVQGVSQLLPNHLLKYPSLEVGRFWPTGPVEVLSGEDCAAQSARTLRGLLESAAARWALAVPITAGLDSRVVVCATRRVKSDLAYFTLKYHHMSSGHEDLRVATALAGTLGLRHSVIECPAEMTPEFRGRYMGNAPSGHAGWGAIAAGLETGYPQGRICVKASVAEVGRQYYGSVREEDIDVNLVLSLANVPGTPVAVESVGLWLEESRDPIRRARLSTLDLFYWEHRMGRWQAQSQLEWDLVQETFTPYNSRDLLVSMLGAPQEWRSAPRYRLFRRVAKRLWPEALSLPVNPVSSSRLRPVVKRLLYPLYVRWKRRIGKRSRTVYAKHAGE